MKMMKKLDGGGVRTSLAPPFDLPMDRMNCSGAMEPPLAGHFIGGTPHFPKKTFGTDTHYICICIYLKRNVGRLNKVPL